MFGGGPLGRMAVSNNLNFRQQLRAGRLSVVTEDLDGILVIVRVWKQSLRDTPSLSPPKRQELVELGYFNPAALCAPQFVALPANLLPSVFGMEKNGTFV